MNLILILLNSYKFKNLKINKIIYKIFILIINSLVLSNTLFYYYFKI